MKNQQLSSLFDQALSDATMDFAREIDEKTSGKKENIHLLNEIIVASEFVEFNWINRIYQLVVPEYSMS